MVIHGIWRSWYPGDNIPWDTVSHGSLILGINYPKDQDQGCQNWSDPWDQNSRVYDWFCPNLWTCFDVDCVLICPLGVKMLSLVNIWDIRDIPRLYSSDLVMQTCMFHCLSQLRCCLIISIPSILLHCFTGTSHVAWQSELSQPPTPLMADFQWGYSGYPRISHEPPILGIMGYYPTFEPIPGIIDPKDRDQSLRKFQGYPDPGILSHE